MIVEKYRVSREDIEEAIRTAIRNSNTLYDLQLNWRDIEKCADEIIEDTIEILKEQV